MALLNSKTERGFTMRLLIINCSPRVKEKSNTNIIINAFSEGYKKDGSTVEICHLSETKNWDSIRRAFYENENILMAVPLYVECIPGIMIEFLESLHPKQEEAGQPKTNLAFILQGGFAEASQLRCGERYLEKLPGYLNCSYAGTLIKGNMFITHMMPEEAAAKIVRPFRQMGETFAEKHHFDKEEASQFAAPEYFSKSFQLFFTLITPFRKLLFDIFFKKHGCKGKLTAKPYQKFLS